MRIAWWVAGGLTVFISTIFVYGLTRRIPIRYIIPDKVQAEGRVLHSRFQVVKDSQRGVKSRGIGGACLVAELQRFGYPHSSYDPNRICMRNSDCLKWGQDTQPDKFTKDAQGKPLPGSWSSYCMNNQCWTRPGAQSDYCNVEKDIERIDGQWTDVPKLGPINVNSVYSQVKANGQPIYWETLACLNGVNILGMTQPDCATPDGTNRREIWSGQGTIVQ